MATSDAVANISVCFRGRDYTVERTASCPGVAITQATGEIMTLLKRAVGNNAAIKGESTAKITVLFQERTFSGDGTGGRPGVAITDATTKVMTEVRRVHPKKRRLKQLERLLEYGFRPTTVLISR